MKTTVLYGIESKYIDVTQLVAKLCERSNDIIIIPKTDDARSSLFGDPCYGHLKHILVNGLVYTHEQECRIRLCDLPNVEYIGNPHKKLASLHSALQLEGGSMSEEYPEQVMAVSFIKGDDIVLELGSNIGRNSLIIASLLDDSRNLTTLETDPETVVTLTKNRDLNGFGFKIINAALSSPAQVLYQQKGKWRCMPEKKGDDWFQVPTCTWDEIGMTPTVLVADCEGALYYILKDYPQILDSVDRILVENDYKEIRQAQFVEQKYKEAGFKLMYNDHSWEARNYNLPLYLEFYQVWSR